MYTTLSLIKRHVDAQGELRLDAVFTKLLIGLLELDERERLETKRFVMDLRHELDRARGVLAEGREAAADEPGVDPAFRAPLKR